MKALKLILVCLLFISPNLFSQTTIHGCTNSLATNYNFDATDNDGSCEFLSVECSGDQIGYVIYMEDTYGDGWNGAEYYMINANGDTVETGTFETGYSAIDTVCIENSCYGLTVSSGQYPTEVSWSIASEFTGYTMSDSYDVNSVVVINNEESDCSIIGCIDSVALNYNNSVVIDDNSCEYQLSETCNEAILIEPNSTLNGYFGEQVWFSFTLETEQLVEINLFTYGYNYSYNSFEIHSSCDINNPVIEQGLIEAGNYFISVNSYYSQHFGDLYSLILNTSDIILGCTDIVAENYNNNSDVDDGSCYYSPGCTDSTYLEFHTQGFIADFDDGSCQTTITLGCTNLESTNYNANANIDDNSCYYSPGCTDSTYLEFHTQGFTADFDDGSCQTTLALGCTNQDATNYNTNANLDDNTCQNLYPIEDPNFLAYLQDTYPLCIVNDSLNILGTGEISEINVYNNNNIWSLDGIQYFENLEVLNCSYNDLVSLPELPSGLTDLNCKGNDLISLSELPSNLSYLNCEFNDLISLPELPNSLTDLNCKGNDLISLPVLPSNLTYLNCYNNDIVNLPVLPNNLTYLDCRFNHLVSLPELPNNLTNLNCYYNDLVSLPELPINLTSLDCSHNDLVSLPELPVNLTSLSCSSNDLNSLPELPVNLTSLYCSSNDVNSLPELPVNLTSLNCSSNELTSLPDIPLSISNLNVENNPIQCVGTYPIQFEISLSQYPNCTNCTDSIAVNYVDGAIYDDGSCQYNIAVGFEIDTNTIISTANISNEASVQINSSFSQDLEDGFLVGGFYTNEQGELICAGYTIWDTNGGNSITLYGDDSTSPEINGLQEGEEIIWVVQDATTQENFYINVELVDGIVGAVFNSSETLEISTFWLLEEGCTNVNSCNYNAAADVDDGSCIEEYLNCEGLCNNDTDEDGICDEIEVVGCTSTMASNYNTNATDDDGTCIIWGCTDENASNYYSLATADNTSCIFSNSYLNLLYTSLDSIQSLYTNLNVAYNNNVDTLSIVTTNLTVQQTLVEDYIWTTDSLNSPIEIDLIGGWNMIGFTRLEPQDVVATFSYITPNILLLKNNEGNVYMPEYGFNGIGDLIPGQGYQLKLWEAIENFTYPNTNGQRIELFPTVPQWAIDMEVEMHPNDIRTLVRVVNMLGQEVNPENQPEGTTLLYLYNDASVEKKVNIKK